MSAVFDHLVVIAATLDEGLDHVEAQTGLRLPEGGFHPMMGTHNHLLRLGEAAFLEVIAPDPQAPPPTRRRWFGLDDPPSVPRLAHWVVRVDDMAAIHPELPHASGPAIEVTRGALSWLLTVAEDGTLPEDGVFPSVIEWQVSPLPPLAMPGAGVTLGELVLSHPDPARLTRMLAPVRPDMPLSIVAAEAPALAARLETPKGAVWLR